MNAHERGESFRAMAREAHGYVTSLLRIRRLEDFDVRLARDLRVAFQTIMANNKHPHKEFSNYLSTQVLIARPIFDDLKKAYAAATDVEADSLTDNAWAAILLARAPFYRFTKACEHRHGYTPKYDEQKRRIGFESVMAD